MPKLKQVLYAPNQLTLLRLIFIPFVIVSIVVEEYGTAFALVLVAGISDGLDGLLARRLGQQTDLGRYLDPIADKLLLTSSFLVLGLERRIPLWVVILVLSRDIIILVTALVMVLTTSVRDFRPSLYGKINTVGQVGKRRKAILELFYSTGIRANELLNLDLYDVDFKRRTVFVKNGKGGKDRVVPFWRKAEAALKDYIEHARKHHAERTGETKLFLSMWGNKLKYKELILVMPRRENGKRLKAHSLRHACAIGMLKNGADIRYIQELLGHSNITSTQIYTRILPAHIQEVHARYHPRGRLKRKFVLSERIPASRNEKIR